MPDGDEKKLRSLTARVIEQYERGTVAIEARRTEEERFLLDLVELVRPALPILVSKLEHDRRSGVVLVKREDRDLILFEGGRFNQDDPLEHFKLRTIVDALIAKLETQLQGRAHAAAKAEKTAERLRKVRTLIWG